MIVDTHVHVVSGEPDRYPLKPSRLGREWWTEEGKDAESLATKMDRNGVERAFLVQPVGAYGYDNSYVLDVAAAMPERFWAVPAVDLDDETLNDAVLAEMMRTLAGSAGVAGVRFFAVAPGSHWVRDSERVRGALAAARNSGLAVVLTVFPEAIRPIGRILEDLPDLRIALDHCGFPELSDGLIPDIAPLFALTGVEGLRLKVSSHLLEQAGDPAALVAQLADAFGDSRIMWGSDYPQAGTDYPALIAMARKACGSLKGRAPSRFLGLNALRFFGAFL